MMNQLQLEYKPDDLGPVFHEAFAKLTSDMLRMNLSDEKAQTKADEHRSPQNIEQKADSYGPHLFGPPSNQMQAVWVGVA